MYAQIKEAQNFKEYSSRDRTHWSTKPKGEWDNEPDKVQWIDPATGLDCLIVRNHAGALCGYVGVPDTHTLHGTPYQDVDVNVHGGLTFSDRCADADEATSICHVPAPGRADHVWWFGFDTAHGFDFVPGFAMARYFDSSDVYRNMDYVASEVTSLAAQLAKMAI